MNYWNGVRLAKGALQRKQGNDLESYKNEVGDLLRLDQDQLIQLSQTKPVHDFILTRNEPNANTQSTRAGHSITGTNPSNNVPAELQVELASCVNGRSHFASVSLFDQNRHPLLLAQQAGGGADEPMTLHTKDFLPAESQPDDRVWTTRVVTVLTSAISMAPLGARMDCTVPVLAEPGTPNGALLGVLRLDPIFADAAKENKSLSSGVAANSRRSSDVFVVLDRQGRILYHSNDALKHQLVSESMPYFQPVANQMFASETPQNFISPGGEEHSTVYTQIPVLNIWVAEASNIDQALADARRNGIIGFIVSVLLALLGALLLTRYAQRKTRGIERVAEGVQAIAKGELDHRIDVRSSDDLRPLADNLGLMTQQLREQIAREAETRQFQSFVRLSSILTHDLKNAIEALSLIVTNMERHFENQEFRSDAMKTLTAATEKLKALVARLSNPVNTLSGEHKRPQPVDLVPMLKRVISMIAEPAGAEHEIAINLPASLLALVDVERMDKVVENLIINALEAMAEKRGTLSVTAGKTESGEVFFSVSDTGEGMTRRFIEERLFRPFATTKRKGVGLGLYTCREVVRANGGSIEVDSQEGAGTTFRVVLPSAAIDESGEKAPHSQSHI